MVLDSINFVRVKGDSSIVGWHEMQSNPVQLTLSKIFVCSYRAISGEHRYDQSRTYQNSKNTD